MIKVGIDAIAFYTPNYVLALSELAQARGVDPDKYSVGLGQLKMSVPPPGEDVVTMGANAAFKALAGEDLSCIEMVLFATESGIDHSKAAGLYLHELLQLNPHCRVIELKQACYAGTFGLQLALPYLRENPTKKILLIAADIARYGLNTTGESSQGAGAVALLLAAQPRIIEFDSEPGFISENVMDFWRPNYREEALVDGKYSSKIYLTMLEKSFRHYQQKSPFALEQHDYFCYHTPVPRLVEKAHAHLLKFNQALQFTAEQRDQHIQHGLTYGRLTGNTYTASLYIALASLLDHAVLLANQRIAFYSYGSGCMAEFFSGKVVENYKNYLHTAYHQKMLAARSPLSAAEYEYMYQFSYVEDGSIQTMPAYKRGTFELSQLKGHQRIYQPTAIDVKQAMPTISAATKKAPEALTVISSACVSAPGKLILSGEHAVVYGAPALAMAVNRYVQATVSEDENKPNIPQFLLDLSDLAHLSQFNLQTLRHLKQRIKNKYRRFIQGDFSIRNVLQKPFELAQFALSIFAETLNLKLPHSIKIKLQSNLPIGCGMGSSAATIVSVLQAVAHYLNQPMSAEKIFQLAIEAENMQHGHSSGLDIQVAFHGGCLFMENKEVQKRLVPQLPMFLVNTGTPLTSTGVCVEQVAPHFRSTQMKNEFAQVTHEMDLALRSQSWVKLCAAIEENQRLLTHIGVVPDRVQQFIREANAMGASAKVCGSGAVAGDAGGAVLFVHPDGDEPEIVTALQAISTKYCYETTAITGEMRGAHAA